MPRIYLHRPAAGAPTGPPAAPASPLDNDADDDNDYAAAMASQIHLATGEGVAPAGSMERNNSSGGVDRRDGGRAFNGGSSSVDEGNGDDADSDAGDDDEEEDDDEDEEEEEDGDDATMTDAVAVPGAESSDAAGDARDDDGRSSPTSAAMLVVKAVPNLDRLFGLREIGREALCWQLSSAKPGNGVEQIRDDSVETYWQSDGNSQPHWIQACFGRRVAISHVCLYLDYALDESYTPRRLQVQVGMTDQDLISAMHPPMTQVELHEPTGWCIIPLSSPPDPLDDCCPASSSGKNPSGNRGYVRAHLIRISILSMHQNGRDTHVRQVQLYGPRLVGGRAASSGADVSSSVPLSKPHEANLYPIAMSSQSYYPAPFQTVEASQFSSIR